MGEVERAGSGIPGSEAAPNIDKKIWRAYQAGLDAFEAGNWDATIAACGKAIEGIARNELPYNERGGTLGQLLEKLPKHIKPEQPLLELAAAAKDPKSLGAHFDLEGEVDRHIASATLSLVESFINYVYAFRAKVAYLKSLVEGGEPAVPADAGGSGSRPADMAPQPARAQDSHFDTFDEDAEPAADPFDLARGRWEMGQG